MRESLRRSVSASQADWVVVRSEGPAKGLAVSIQARGVKFRPPSPSEKLRAATGPATGAAKPGRRGALWLVGVAAGALLAAAIVYAAV